MWTHTEGLEGLDPRGRLNFKARLTPPEWGCLPGKHSKSPRFKEGRSWFLDFRWKKNRPKQTLQQEGPENDSKEVIPKIFSKKRILSVEKWVENVEAHSWVFFPQVWVFIFDCPPKSLEGGVIFWFAYFCNASVWRLFLGEFLLFLGINACLATQTYTHSSIHTSIRPIHPSIHSNIFFYPWGLAFGVDVVVNTGMEVHRK